MLRGTKFRVVFFFEALPKLGNIVYLKIVYHKTCNLTRHAHPTVIQDQLKLHATISNIQSERVVKNLSFQQDYAGFPIKIYAYELLAV